MEQTGTLQAKAPKRGISADTLKLIAIAAMLIDHAAYLFVQEYYSLPGVILHGIGRITGPIMFYFIAEGYHYTRNKNRYTLRLLLFALVSYLPFIYFMTGKLPTSETALRFSVGYTLLLGLLVLRARHEIKNTALRWLVIAVLFLLSRYGDWSYIALLCILVFDVYRGSFKKQATGYTVIVLAGFFQILFSFLDMVENGQPLFVLAPTAGYLAVQLCMFLPLIFLRFYNGQKGRLGRVGKWIFYVFYPLHLVLVRLLFDVLSRG